MLWQKSLHSKMSFSRRGKKSKESGTERKMWERKVISVSVLNQVLHLWNVNEHFPAGAKEIIFLNNVLLDNCYTSKQQWCPCRSPWNEALIYTFTFRLQRLIYHHLGMYNCHTNPNLLLVQMALHSPHYCIHSPQKARENKNEQSVYKHPDPLADIAARRMWFT